MRPLSLSIVTLWLVGKAQNKNRRKIKTIVLFFHLIDVKIKLKRKTITSSSFIKNVEGIS